MCYSPGMHSTDLKEMKVNLLMLGFQGIQISTTKTKQTSKDDFFPKTERKKKRQFLSDETLWRLWRVVNRGMPSETLSW